MEQNEPLSLHKNILSNTEKIGSLANMVNQLINEIKDMRQSASDHFNLNVILFGLLFRHDENFRQEALSAFLKLLQNQDPNTALSPTLRPLVQMIRDGLKIEPDPELVSSLSKPPLQPVK